LNVLKDLDAGLIGSIQSRSQGEVFDEFLDHAREYVKLGMQNEAAVIAGVVFEDTLRKLYSMKMAKSDRPKLDQIISELATNGALSPLRAKQARVGAHVRTKATHADWADIDMPAVEQTIRLVDEILNQHFA
jgi:hypothetical protein